MVYKSAVIGLGNIGFKFTSDKKRKNTWTHVGAYGKCKDTTLVAAVEINPENIRFFKRRNPGIPVYETVDALFDNEKIDIVSICAPTEAHFSVCRDVMKRGVKAIFCEKPLTYSASDSERILRMTAKYRTVMAVNYSRRWESLYNFVRKMVEGGKIGKVRAVHSFYPGQVYNIGSHLFDTILFLTGLCPEFVSGVKVSGFSDPSVSGWIKCKRGALITFSSTGKREDLIFEIDIVGDGGRLRIVDNGCGIEFFVFKESKKYSGYRELHRERIDLPRKNDRLKEALSDIIDVLEGRRKNVKCPAEEALFVDRIIEKAIISAKRKGKPERI